MHARILAAALAILTAANAGVLFETSFESLPPGWSNDNWEFYGGDARIDVLVNHWSGDFQADMHTYGEQPVLYFVPDGTDSVVVHIEHDIYMGGEDIYAFVSVSDGLGSDTLIFEEQVSNDGFSTDDPVHYVLHDPQPDTWLGFQFHGEANNHYYMATSQLDWRIFDMTVLAYGDSLALPSMTWGAIKLQASICD